MNSQKLIYFALAAIALGSTGCAKKASDGVGQDADVDAKVKQSPFSAQPISPVGISFAIPGSLLEPAQSRPILEASIDGALRVEWDTPELFTRTSGYCLGIVHSFKDNQTLDLSKGRVIPARVSQLDDQGAFPGLFALDVPRNLPEQVRAGKDRLILFAPDDATTDQIRSLPSMTPFDNSSFVAFEEAVKRRNELVDRYKNQDAEKPQSTNNLKQIGLALHNFLSSHGNFPPAVIDGPDGKPRHSWRVLILPYLEQSAVYNAYNFKQPWDGPDNKKLLARMPNVYRKPGDKSHFTHYVVPRGPSTIFPLVAAKHSGIPNDKSLYDQKGSGFTKISSITDGTSNTISVGTVDPDRKIEWMKPEDIDYPDVGTASRRLASLGDPDGLATPYMSDDGPFGLFLFGDGSVHSLHRSVTDMVFTALLTRNGGEVISSDSFGTGNTTYTPASILSGFRLTIRPVGTDVVARLEDIPRGAEPNRRGLSQPNQKSDAGRAKSPR
jgi:Protein of unknown function (DUF1559)